MNPFKIFRKKQKPITLTFIISPEVIAELKAREEKHITDQMIADSIVAYVTVATLNEFKLTSL